VKPIINGLVVTVIVLAGTVAFLAYSSQENIEQTLIKLTNPCLDMWSEIDEIADPSFSRNDDPKKIEIATKFFGSGCRENLDWMPDDHPHKKRLTEMWMPRP